MHGVVTHLYYFFAHLGAFGLLLLGVLDSSFLFMPLGNDLLIVALTARKPAHLPLYIAMATAGSTLGCALIDVVARRGGEEGLERLMSKNRLEYVKRKVSGSAGRVLALAAIMPPPFPFTPFVAGAAAFQYPRKKLYSILAGMRAVRFGILGCLALVFGRRLLRLADSPVVIGFVLAILAIAVVGSVLSVWSWIRRARSGRTVPVSGEPEPAR